MVNYMLREYVEDLGVLVETNLVVCRSLKAESWKVMSEYIVLT